MNEMVAMGVLAIRLQGLNKTLEWDGANMRFTNIGDDETLRTVIKDGFKIHNGHPSFDKTWTDPVNAKAFCRRAHQTQLPRRLEVARYAQINIKKSTGTWFPVLINEY